MKSQKEIRAEMEARREDDMRMNSYSRWDRYDISLNGNDLIKGHRFYNEESMKEFVIRTMKKDSCKDSTEVVVALSVTDKITPRHFIRHTFRKDRSEIKYEMR